MKTINDLVNELNILFDDSEFYIEKHDAYNESNILFDDSEFYIERHDAYDVLDGYIIYMKNHNVVNELIEIDEKYNGWCAGWAFGLASADVQKEIMDFIYTTDSNHWFDEPEKKYNIVIGEDVRTERYRYKTAYRKVPKGIEVWDSVKEGDLTSDRYIFTKSEIEQLKVRLPENMAKIIDLGKVEVKDD